MVTEYGTLSQAHVFVSIHLHLLPFCQLQMIVFIDINVLWCIIGIKAFNIFICRLCSETTMQSFSMITSLRV